MTLSFLPGAKIGVVGPNGAGKSSLLKIMAGLDQPSNGEARLMPGYTVGMLAQEPPLNEAKTVLGNVEEAVAETKAKLERFNEIAEQMATDYSDELMEEMGKLQEELDHADAWDIDSKLEQAMDALRCPPPDADVTQLSGGERRRVALCKLLLEAARPAAARRAHQPPGRGERAVAGAAPGQVRRHRHRDHPRPVLPGQRGQWILELDRGRAYPYEGNYSTYLEKKAARLAVEGRKDAKMKKRLTDELEWVRSNAKARQTKSKARLDRYEEMAAEAEKTRKLDFEEIQIPPGPRLGSTVIEAQQPQQGLRRPGAHRRPVASRCRATASSASSARTASARPRCSRRSSGWSSRTAARSGSARPSSCPTSTRAGPASTRTRRSGRSSPTGSTT